MKISKRKTNGIVAYWHCRECLKEMPSELSPAEWQRIECGWTKTGFQAWCVRHDRNVICINLEGHEVTSSAKGRTN